MPLGLELWKVVGAGCASGEVRGTPHPVSGQAESTGIVARLTPDDSMRNNDQAPSSGSFVPSCASWVGTVTRARPCLWPCPPGGWPEGAERHPVCVRRPAVSSEQSPLSWAGPEERTSSLAFEAPVAFLVGGAQSRLWTRGSEHL